MIDTRTTSTGNSLLPGFTDPVHGAQRSFRALMTALSEPGRIIDIGDGLTGPAGVSPAAVATLLTLADFETPLWLGDTFAAGATGRHVRFHTGASVAANPDTAMLALIAAMDAARLLPLFNAGTDQYPDRSATVIIEVPALTGGMTVTLTGPGIADSATISPAGLGPDFWAMVTANHALYPRGVDVYFTAGHSVIGLPRSTHTAAATGLGG